MKPWALGRNHRLVVASVVIAIGAGGAVGIATPPAAGATVSSARDVQQRLAELKFLRPSEVDGKLGPRTRDAITAFQQWSGVTPDGIAGPNTLAKLRTAAAPKPASKGPSHRIEVYRSKGITLLIDNGKLVRVMHSSAGKRGFETPTGSYRVQRKVLMDWSRPYKAWMPYASYFVRGYALHESSVPSYPASHGCVRLTPWDAADTYRFATIGTAVIVY